MYYNQKCVFACSLVIAIALSAGVITVSYFAYPLNSYSLCSDSCPVHINNQTHQYFVCCPTTNKCQTYNATASELNNLPSSEKCWTHNRETVIEVDPLSGKDFVILFSYDILICWMMTVPYLLAIFLTYRINTVIDTESHDYYKEHLVGGVTLVYGLFTYIVYFMISTIILQRTPQYSNHPNYVFILLIDFGMTAFALTVMYCQAYGLQKWYQNRVVTATRLP